MLQNYPTGLGHNDDEKMMFPMLYVFYVATLLVVKGSSKVTTDKLTPSKIAFLKSEQHVFQRTFVYRSAFASSLVARNVCVDTVDKKVTFYVPSTAEVNYHKGASETLQHVSRLLPGYTYDIAIRPPTLPFPTVKEPAWLSILDFDNYNPYHWAMRHFFLLDAPFDDCAKLFYTNHLSLSLWHRQTLEIIMASCIDMKNEKYASDVAHTNVHVLASSVCFASAFLPGNGDSEAWLPATASGREGFRNRVMQVDGRRRYRMGAGRLVHAPKLTSSAFKIAVLQRHNTRKFLDTSFVQRWNGVHFNCTSMVLDVDSDKSLREIATSLWDVDILIAAHGAGLVHMLYLPQCAGVVEVRLFNSFRRHYKVLSEENGIAYASVESNKNPFAEDNECGPLRMNNSTSCGWDAPAWNNAEYVHYNEQELLQAVQRVWAEVDECRQRTKNHSNL